MLELMLLATLMLLFIISFLIYRIYKIRYMGKSKLNSMFIPEIENFKESGWELKFSSKLSEIDAKLSELEERVKEQEDNVKMLAKALSSE